MQYIDEKFKDLKPEETVQNIKNILDSVGIEVCEDWHDSGVDNCYSLTLTGKGTAFFSNGKGVSEDFARASAYAEFIERLQGGLLLYKLQSIGKDPDMNIQTFAPDVKYMTVEELVENGEWMDYLIEKVASPKVTRESIAKLCKICDPSDSDKVLTLPFYSLFEKKYVYLPMAFVDQVYCTNGCCAGNTREEAWVHAFSELMERHSCVETMSSGRVLPLIPEEVLDSFSVVKKILDEIRRSGDYHIDVFDASLDNGYTVVSTRIINRNTHSYQINFAGDPVFEIALQRTLTELLQGVHVNKIATSHDGRMLKKATLATATNNVLNQLVSGKGYFTADYFANEITCTETFKGFEDNNNKTNKELLEYALGVFKKLGRPVYVRNYSFLGFHSYRFVVPGFSEALIGRLTETVSEFAIADDARKTFLDVASADDNDLNMFMFYNNMIKDVFSKYNHFGRLSGIPISRTKNILLCCVTRAYAAFKLKKYKEAINYLSSYTRHSSADPETKEYFICINKYIELMMMGLEDDKIRLILNKFFKENYVNKLYDNLESGKTPYDEYLLKCDFKSCDVCRYKNDCTYQYTREIHRVVGKRYLEFTHGQDESVFAI